MTVPAWATTPLTADGIIILPDYFYAFDSVNTRRDITVTWCKVTSATNVKSMRCLAELNTGATGDPYCPAMRAGMASYFVTGKSELFPFGQATIDSCQGNLIQNPGINK
ncbi:hypothetical protein A3860_20530 [Niastella vici]|uniref:Uncharacterized protein n=1 Tax=Niastella vici TaxID=1703345 RepID=A0A1V9G1B7_9BACT|nr:hypothetical protein [Niastella vici]OQP64360.1 hypothetical protein A3860_20530 [Niastella vici]